MKWNYLLLFVVYQFLHHAVSAQVGIGTSTPNPSTILDIRSTNKGIVFPSMTSTQRDAIPNPPDGLHIYNKTERCLNLFDSTFATWTCYCEMDTCKAILVRITTNASTIDFNTTYASVYPTARKFTVIIDPGVIISNGISFFNMPAQNSYTIKIVNRGGIYGSGGAGGGGASGAAGQCAIPPGAGNPGSAAIITKAGFKVTIDNYGIIAGGGGGGGGGGRVTTDQFGGGGGGGAGAFAGNGGTGGGNTISLPFGGGCGTLSPIAQGGTPGTINTGGTGGAGNNGGGIGGNGGGLAQQGTMGTGAGAPAGGAAGKAVQSIGGASLTVINNIAGGQVLGVVE
jgi:hypothetical protein